jgi:hypothetical protein
MRPQNANLKRTAGPGRPQGCPNKVTLEVRAFAQQFINDPAYLENLRKRIFQGKAPQMEQLMWHYGYGKPKEQAIVSRPARFIMKIDDHHH